MGKTWEVVGGGDKGGILVRKGIELEAAKFGERLATGAFVEELALEGERLHYRLLSGSRPSDGWVTLKLGDRPLLRKWRFVLDDMLANHCPGTPVEDKYSFDTEEPIAWGSYGVVFEATHRTTKTKRAIKMMHVPPGTPADNTELTALQKLDHPNIMKFYEYFRASSVAYFVTELCSGGSFRDYFDTPEITAEHEKTRLLFRDVTRALAYCHSMGLVHRDIKCDNCLVYDENRQKPVAKVIDFGIAAMREPRVCKPDQSQDGGPTSPNGWLNDVIGTDFNRAPEVLNPDVQYGPKADMWSLGVMLHLVCTKEHPFHGGSFGPAPLGCSESPLMFMRFDAAPLSDVPAEPRDLVLKLLSLDTDQRPNASAALRHPWFADQPSIRKRVSVSTDPSLKRSASMVGRALDRVSSFLSLSPPHQAILRLIAHFSNERTVEDSRACFLSFDRNNDGTLSKQELLDMYEFSCHEMPGDDVDAIFEKLNANCSGKVHCTEWLAATLVAPVVVAEETMKEVFSFFDTDASHSISICELRKALGHEAECVLQDADTNGDGVLEWSEFVEMVRGLARTFVR